MNIPTPTFEELQIGERVVCIDPRLGSQSWRWYGHVIERHQAGGDPPVVQVEWDTGGYTTFSGPKPGKRWWGRVGDHPSNRPRSLVFEEDL